MLPEAWSPLHPAFPSLLRIMRGDSSALAVCLSRRVSDDCAGGRPCLPTNWDRAPSHGSPLISQMYLTSFHPRKSPKSQTTRRTDMFYYFVLQAKKRSFKKLRGVSDSRPLASPGSKDCPCTDHTTSTHPGLARLLPCDPSTLY